MLLSEVESRGVSQLSAFSLHNIHFSNTLPLLRAVIYFKYYCSYDYGFLVILQMKKDGLEILKGSSLGLANLHKKIVGSDIEGTFIF